MFCFFGIVGLLYYTLVSWYSILHSNIPKKRKTTPGARPMKRRGSGTLRWWYTKS